MADRIVQSGPAAGFIVPEEDVALLESDPRTQHLMQDPRTQQLAGGLGEMTTQEYPKDLIDPDLKRQALIRMEERKYGIERTPGRAARPARDILLGRTVQREEAPGDPEAMAARAELADQNRGLARDARDIEFQRNELARQQLDREIVEAREQTEDMKLRRQSIDDDIRFEEEDLAAQKQKHRDMIAKGIDPWQAFGGTAGGKLGAIFGMMTAQLGTQGGAQRSMQLFNNLINREVESQKYEWETQGDQVKNAYGALRDSLEDRDQAEAAFRALLMNQFAFETERLMGELADPQAQLEANKLIAAIDEAEIDQLDAYRTRSANKITEKYAHDPGQAASGPGVRFIDATPHNKRLTDIRAQEMETQKGAVEMQSMFAPGSQDDAIFEEIKPQFKKYLGDRARANADFTQVFEALGGKYDPKTGKVHGLDPNKDHGGIGFWGSMKPRLALSPEEQALRGKIQQTIYNYIRPDTGANFTGHEQRFIEEFTSAGVTEAQQIKLLQQLAETNVRQMDEFKNSTLSAREQRVWDAQQERMHSFREPQTLGGVKR